MSEKGVNNTNERVEQMTIVKNIMAAKLYTDLGDGTIKKNEVEQFAVIEFGKLAHQYGIEFALVKCHGIFIQGNFTIVHLSIEFKNGIRLGIYGVSKLRVDGTNDIHTGVSMAIRNLIKTLIGKNTIYKKRGEE